MSVSSWNRHCRNCSHCKIVKALCGRKYFCRKKDNQKVKPTDICNKYKEAL